MSLSDIVNVQTHISAATVIQQGFGVPLVLAYHTHWTDFVRTYDAASWQEALDDEGFEVTEPAYLAVAAMMRQTPRPKTFKIGRRTVAATQILHIVPTTDSEGYVHKLTIGAADGNVFPVQFTEPAAATVAALCTGIAAAINLTDAEVTADGASGTHVVITADDSNALHEIYGMTPTLMMQDKTTSDVLTFTADLDNIRDADDSWYALVLASPAPAAIEVAADWVESTQRKILVASTHDGDVLTAVTTDIASSIKAQGYMRTHVAFNQRSLSMMDAAWTSIMLTYEPGQATWMFKTLAGVYADKLTANQENHLEGKYASYYQALLGTNNTGEGKSGSGIYIDLVQLSDWAKARTEEGVVAVLRAAPKVKFTDADAGNKFYGVFRNVIAMGVANDAIRPEDDTWTINVPKVAEIPAIDRQNRRFTGMSYSFTATGAVHGVDTINIFVNV